MLVLGTALYSGAVISSKLWRVVHTGGDIGMMKPWHIAAQTAMALSVLVAALMLAAAWGLAKGKRWAWVAALTACCLLIPAGLLFPALTLLAGVGLWGLLGRDTIKAFRGPAGPDSPGPAA